MQRRTSSTTRSAAWVKASYYSENDNLITFGTQEPDIPAYTLPGRWQTLGVQQNNCLIDAADILNTGNKYLYYQADDYFIYFQFFLEAAPDETSGTYSVFIDTNTDDTYDYCIATYAESDTVRLYKWGGVSEGWDNANKITLGSGYCNFITSDPYVAQFAVLRADIANPSGNWQSRAVTNGFEKYTYEEGEIYETTNSPEPGVNHGDFTTPGTIPEFSDGVVPVVFIAALFVVSRKRKNLLNER